MLVIPDKWWQELPIGLIKTTAEHHSLDWKLVSAIVYKESKGNSFAIRYERNWTYFHPESTEIAKSLSQPMSSCFTMQAMSWGMMQVMGTVAYECGLSFNRFPSELCLPQVGLEYGCRQLTRLFNRGYNLTAVIAAYNAGSPRMGSGGKFVNQEYVDDVLGLMASLG
jgi:hypothetical protein